MRVDSQIWMLSILCEAIQSNQKEKTKNSEKRVAAKERVTVERAPEITMLGM